MPNFRLKVAMPTFFSGGNDHIFNPPNTQPKPIVSSQYPNSSKLLSQVNPEELKAEPYFLPVFEFDDTNEHETERERFKRIGQEAELIRQIEQYYWKYGTLPANAGNLSTLSAWRSALRTHPQPIREDDNTERDLLFTKAKTQFNNRKVKALEAQIARKRAGIFPANFEGTFEQLVENETQERKNVLIQRNDNLVLLQQKLEQAKQEGLHLRRIMTIIEKKSVRERAVELARKEYFFSYWIDPENFKVYYTEPVLKQQVLLPGGENGSRYGADSFVIDAFCEFMAGNVATWEKYLKQDIAHDERNAIESFFPPLFQNPDLDLQSTPNRTIFLQNKLNTLTTNEKLILLRQSAGRLYEQLDKFYKIKLLIDPIRKLNTEIKQLVKEKDSWKKFWPGYVDRKNRLIQEKLNQLNNLLTPELRNTIQLLPNIPDLNNLNTTILNTFTRHMDYYLDQKVLQLAALPEIFAINSKRLTEFFINDQNPYVREVACQQVYADRHVFSRMVKDLPLIVGKSGLSEADKDIYVNHGQKKLYEGYLQLQELDWNHEISGDVQKTLERTIDQRIEEIKTGTGQRANSQVPQVSSIARFNKLFNHKLHPGYDLTKHGSEHPELFKPIIAESLPEENVLELEDETRDSLPVIPQPQPEPVPQILESNVNADASVIPEPASVPSPETSNPAPIEPPKKTPVLKRLRTPRADPIETSPRELAAKAPIPPPPAKAPPHARLNASTFDAGSDDEDLNKPLTATVSQTV